MTFLSHQKFDQDRAARWIFRDNVALDPIDARIPDNVIEFQPNRTEVESRSEHVQRQADIIRLNTGDVMKHFRDAPEGFEEGIGTKQVAWVEQHTTGKIPLIKEVTPLESSMKWLGAWKSSTMFRVEDPNGVVGNQELKFMQPLFWMNMFLRSKRGVLDLVENYAETATDYHKESKYNYSNVEYALLDKTMKSTLKGIDSGGGNQKGLSLASINHLDKVTDGFINEIEGDLNEALKDIIPKLKDQERWKQVLKQTLGLGRLNRLPWMIKKQLEQLKQARVEIQSNINALREYRERQMENSKNRINMYIGQAHLQANDTRKQAFWTLVSAVSQNPTLFIDNPQNAMFQGLDWKKLFGCSSPVDFLDVLSVYYLDSVIDMQNIERLDFDMNETVVNIQERNNDVQGVLSDIDFAEIQDGLRAQNIEMGSAENVTARQIVEELNDALQEVHIQRGNDENIEDLVYRDAPIRLSYEEKFLYLMKYLSGGDRDGLNTDLNSINDEAKQKLSRYLFLIDAKTKDWYVSGGFTEKGISNKTRKTVLDMAAVVKNTANDSLALFGQDLIEMIKSTDGSLFQTELRKLKTFLGAYDQLTDIIAIKDVDEKTILEKLPPAEKEIIENIKTTLLSLKNKFKGDNGLIEYLEGQRENYENEVLNKLPPNPETYADEKREFMNAYNDIRAQLSTGDDTDGIDSEEAARRLYSNLPGIGAAQNGLGMNFVAGVETVPNTLEDLARNMFDRIRDWDEAMAKKEAYTFELPENFEQTYQVLMDNISTGLSRVQSQLGNIEDAAGEADDNNLNARLNRYFGNEITEYMEADYRPRLEKNSRQQWDRLKGMPEGVSISQFKFINTTHLGGQYNLTNGILHPTLLEGMRVIRNNGDHLVLETETHIVILTEPKSHDSGEANQANVYVWDKANIAGGRAEVGNLDQNLNFRGAGTNYNKAGVFVSALPRNESAPEHLKNTRRAV